MTNPLPPLPPPRFNRYQSCFYFPRLVFRVPFSLPFLWLWMKGGTAKASQVQFGEVSTTRA